MAVQEGKSLSCRGGRHSGHPNGAKVSVVADGARAVGRPDRDRRVGVVRRGIYELWVSSLCIRRQKRRGVVPARAYSRRRQRIAARSCALSRPSAAPCTRPCPRLRRAASTKPTTIARAMAPAATSGGACLTAKSNGPCTAAAFRTRRPSSEPEDAPTLCQQIASDASRTEYPANQTRHPRSTSSKPATNRASHPPVRRNSSSEIRVLAPDGHAVGASRACPALTNRQPGRPSPPLPRSSRVAS